MRGAVSLCQRVSVEHRATIRGQLWHRRRGGGRRRVRLGRRRECFVTKVGRLALRRCKLSLSGRLEFCGVGRVW